LKLSSFSFFYFYRIEIGGATVYWTFSYVDRHRKCRQMFLWGNILEKVSLDDRVFVWLEKIAEHLVKWQALIFSCVKILIYT